MPCGAASSNSESQARYFERRTRRSSSSGMLFSRFASIVKLEVAAAEIFLDVSFRLTGRGPAGAAARRRLACGCEGSSRFPRSPAWCGSPSCSGWNRLGYLADSRISDALYKHNARVSKLEHRSFLDYTPAQCLFCATFPLRCCCPSGNSAFGSGCSVRRCASLRPASNHHSTSPIVVLTNHSSPCFPNGCRSLMLIWRAGVDAKKRAAITGGSKLNC